MDWLNIVGHLTELQLHTNYMIRNYSRELVKQSLSEVPSLYWWLAVAGNMHSKAPIADSLNPGPWTRICSPEFYQG